MRGPVAITLLLSVTSCDRVLGLNERMPDAAGPVDVLEVDALDAAVLDLDMDNIPDSIDPCIHSPSDLIGDLDSDGVTNDGDTCPFDGPNGADPDGDGLGVACDPFPTATDRSRCLIRFSDPTLNTALWASRAPDMAWSTIPGKLIADPPMVGQTLATTVVSTSIEGETVTSYDISSDVDTRAGFGSLTVWLRADPQATSSSDIGCRWVIEPGAGSRIAVVQGTTLLDAKPFVAPSNPPALVRINARLVTTGAIGAPARVTCQFSWMLQAAVAEASPELAPGRFGLTVDRWLVQLSAIHILDRAP